jgi:hypothetical protein
MMMAGRLFSIHISRGVLILQRYRHAVTKAKSRIQGIETGGGILADEMGMGKSLSILALITKTLESSNIWVTEGDVDIHSESPARRRRSPATLVIVPSASTLLQTSVASNYRF